MIQLLLQPSTNLKAHLQQSLMTLPLRYSSNIKPDPGTIHFFSLYILAAEHCCRKILKIGPQTLQLMIPCIKLVFKDIYQSFPWLWSASSLSPLVADTNKNVRYYLW